ncbi:MAG: DUF1320 domain-containing protein [Gammaproteobacteria bacterium]|nr:DUF1320 domain-containing protein [Gammaproteobacteria bacterium]
MAYAIVNDLITRLGNKAVIELTNPNQRATDIDETVAMAAINDGAAIVDSYIGQRTTLPLAAVPPLVKTLTVDLAIYYLKTKVGNSNSKESSVAKLYDDAIRHLERFAAGKTSLGVPLSVLDGNADNDDEKEKQTDSAEITSNPRQNTRHSLGKLT